MAWLTTCSVYLLLALCHLCCSSRSFFPPLANGLRFPGRVRKASPILRDVYEAVDEDNATSTVYVRHIPGDGSCLFHALAVSLIQRVTARHVGFDSQVRLLSHRLRQIAVDVLSNDSALLFIDNGDLVSAADILEMSAAQMNKTCQAYLDDMRCPGEWGGGPEIAALCTYLKRPIHVFELNVSRDGGFYFELTARFGSPQLASRAALNILCADGRCVCL